MPSRKRTDLSRMTRNAKRLKRARAQQVKERFTSGIYIYRPGRPRRSRAPPRPCAATSLYLPEPPSAEALCGRVVALMTDARLARRARRGRLVALTAHTGVDCECLWYNLQASTVKKLRYSLAAQDRPERLLPTQRMDAADWLLCDALLVHRRHDLTFAPRDPTLESPILSELFRLVQQFRVEELFGEALAEAWAALALAYNSDGRRATPMLLQRRWYQLRAAASCAAAGAVAPAANTPALLEDILARCPWLGEEPLDSWEELIEKKLVVPREQLEAIGWKKIATDTDSGDDFQSNVDRKLVMPSFIKQENGDRIIDDAIVYIPEIKPELNDVVGTCTIGATMDVGNEVLQSHTPIKEQNNYEDIRFCEDRLRNIAGFAKIPVEETIVNSDITNSTHGNVYHPLENISIKTEINDTDFGQTTPSEHQSASIEWNIKSEFTDFEETILSAANNDNIECTSHVSIQVDESLHSVYIKNEISVMDFEEQ